jgi:hypothetical protein
MGNGNGWNETFPIYLISELSSNIDPACLAQVIYLSVRENSSLLRSNTITEFTYPPCSNIFSLLHLHGMRASSVQFDKPTPEQIVLGFNFVLL